MWPMAQAAPNVVGKRGFEEVAMELDALQAALRSP